MSKSIKLHKEFGLNPTIPVCFWCGRETGEIALLGASIKGEAPKNTVIGYEPCSTCKEDMAKGITLVEATATPNTDGQASLQSNSLTGGAGIYPTGAWVVVSKEAALRVLPHYFPDDIAQLTFQTGRAFLEPGVWDALDLPRENDADVE